MKKITKLLFTIIFIFGLSNLSYAQKDYGALNVQVRFGSFSKYYSYNDNYNNPSNSNAGLNVFYEIPVADKITVSPAVGLSFNFDWVLLGARADYYFEDHIPNLPEELNLHGGVDSGFILGLDDFVGNSFEINFHAGGEWRFNDMWGGIAEFGVGTSSYGSAGVGIHF